MPLSAPVVLPGHSRAMTEHSSATTCDFFAMTFTSSATSADSHTRTGHFLAMTCNSSPVIRDFWLMTFNFSATTANLPAMTGHFAVMTAISH